MKESRADGSIWFLLSGPVMREMHPHAGWALNALFPLSLSFSPSCPSLLSLFERAGNPLFSLDPVVVVPFWWFCFGFLPSASLQMVGEMCAVYRKPR